MHAMMTMQFSLPTMFFVAKWVFEDAKLVSNELLQVQY